MDCFFLSLMHQFIPLNVLLWHDFLTAIACDLVVTFCFYTWQHFFVDHSILTYGYGAKESRGMQQLYFLILLQLNFRELFMENLFEFLKNVLRHKVD